MNTVRPKVNRESFTCLSLDNRKTALTLESFTPAKIWTSDPDVRRCRSFRSATSRSEVVFSLNDRLAKPGEQGEFMPVPKEHTFVMTKMPGQQLAVLGQYANEGNFFSLVAFLCSISFLQQSFSACWGGFLVAPCCSQGATLQVTLQCHPSNGLSVHGRTPPVLNWLPPYPLAKSTQLNLKGYTNAYWLAN